MTALPMILAEELSLDWNKVKIEQAPTNPAIYDHGTGGSGSIAGSWLPLRQAGAAAREMLITAAAQRWNVNRDTCKAAGWRSAARRAQEFSDLRRTGGRRGKAADSGFQDRAAEEFRRLHDRRARHEPLRRQRKGDGQSAKFGIDSRMPGMQFAVIARCPIFGGKVKSFDATKAKAVPGVQDVFAIEPVGEGAFSAGGVAVLADNSWAAMQGRKALQITWDEGPHAAESSEWLHAQFLENAAKPGKVVRNDGDADAAIAGAAKKVEATYEFPFAAHATMEPMNCTVHIRPDGAEAWVPTQAPQWAQDIIAGDFEAAAGISDCSHDADGRRVRPAVHGRLCDGSRADFESDRQAGAGFVDARRRHAARFLPAGVVSQAVRRCGREGKSCSVETFPDFDFD